MRKPKSRKASVANLEEEGESVVEAVTKEQALLLAGAEAEEPLPVMVLEHDEDVTAWAEVIRKWMQRQGIESAAMTQLQEGSELPVVKLWLAALLCGLGMEQRGRFYDVGGVAIKVS